MKRFISSVVFALTILSGTASFPQSLLLAESNKGVPDSTASDSVDVQHVIDAYHEAVLAHDGSRLAHLFIPQGSMWLNVLSDDAYARAKAKSPDAVKIRVGSYTDFAKVVSTSKASFNPTHTHLQVNSDGTIASVYFDFRISSRRKGTKSWERDLGVG
jgi:hypothetical protein